MKGRRTEITVETYEVLLIKQRGSLSHSWCRSCSKQVTLISLDDACTAGLSAETISQRGEDGQFHLIEMAGWPPFICLSSLIQTLEEKQVMYRHPIA
jgi:hypothetical protein